MALQHNNSTSHYYLALLRTVANALAISSIRLARASPVKTCLSSIEISLSLAYISA